MSNQVGSDHGICLDRLYNTVPAWIKPWEPNIQELFSQLQSPDSFDRQFNYVDPLYGREKLSPELMDLINTAPMRRLGAVSQMTVGMTEKGRGIEHSRLTHSIGASILAGRVADQLEFNSHERILVQVLALLHDLRHGPFSHIYDHMHIDGRPFDHDIRSIDFLQAPDLAKALKGLGLSPEEIFSNLTDKREGTGQLARPMGYLAKELLDRVDYLRRDTYNASFIPQYCHEAIARTCSDLLRVLQYNREQNLIVVEEHDIGIVQRFYMWRAFAFQVVPLDRATQALNAYLRREADRSLKHMTEAQRNQFLKESTSFTDEQLLSYFDPKAREILKGGKFESNFAVLNVIQAGSLTRKGVEFLRVHPTKELIERSCGKRFCEDVDPLISRRPRPPSPITFNFQSHTGYIEERRVMPLALPDELVEMTHGHLAPGIIPVGCDSSEVMICCHSGEWGDTDRLIDAQNKIQKALVDEGLIQVGNDTRVGLDLLTAHNRH